MQHCFWNICARNNAAPHNFVSQLRTCIYNAYLQQTKFTKIFESKLKLNKLKRSRLEEGSHYYESFQGFSASLVEYLELFTYFSLSQQGLYFDVQLNLRRHLRHIITFPTIIVMSFRIKSSDSNENVFDMRPWSERVDVESVLAYLVINND